MLGASSPILIYSNYAFITDFWSSADDQMKGWMIGLLWPLLFVPMTLAWLGVALPAACLLASNGWVSRVLFGLVGAVCLVMLRTMFETQGGWTGSSNKSLNDVFSLGLLVLTTWPLTVVAWLFMQSSVGEKSERPPPS